MTQLEQSVLNMDESRQRQADMSEIAQLVAAYGPAAEAINLDFLSCFWSEDACYDLGESWIVEGKSDILAGYTGDTHKQMVAQGCAHIATVPVIVISGDSASATHHVTLFTHRAGGFEVHRIVVARWEFDRSRTGRWTAVSRTLRNVGSTGATELLAAAHSAPGER